jgi:hypothetical protein
MHADNKAQQGRVVKLFKLTPANQLLVTEQLIKFTAP